MVNTLRPRQNGCRFADNVFKCIFVNENVWISLKISLKFVPKVPISNIPALVQILAWRRSGDKPLSEPMMVRLLTHICVTRPQWVKAADDLDIYITRVPSLIILTPLNKLGNSYQHGNVMAWKCFHHYWPFVRGIHRSPKSKVFSGTVAVQLFILLIDVRKVVPWRCMQ